METNTLVKRKITAKNSEDVTRGNKFKIDPRKIVVNWESNERIDYGDDFPEFKELIKEYGVLQNLKLYADAQGNWHLRHGFRRMRAVLELIEEGVNIETVPFDEVKNNEEQALIDHFVLNTGKNLSDVEMANSLRKLKALTGITNITELAKKVGLNYQKVVILLDFAETAGTQVQEAILKGQTSFNIGRQIVKAAGSITEQNEILEQGKENARREGKTKVRKTHIPIDHPVVTSTTPFDENLAKIMDEADKIKGLDRNFYNRVNNLIEMVKIGSPHDEIMLLFIP